MTSHAKSSAAGDGVSRAQEKVADRLRTGRTAVADAIDTAASRVVAGADHVAEAAHTAADRMGSSAAWLRDTNTRDMLMSFRTMVAEHPGRTVVGAVVLGFIAGRMLRRH